MHPFCGIFPNILNYLFLYNYIDKLSVQFLQSIYFKRFLKMLILR